MHDHANIGAGELAFIAKLVAWGGHDGADHSLGASAHAREIDVVPGNDEAANEPITILSFFLAPVHPFAVAPERSDDVMALATFAIQLLGDAVQAGNPVRQHFLARDIDLLDGPSLAGFEADVRAIVRAVGVSIEPTLRKKLPSPYTRSPRDFWPESWHGDVAQAVDHWRGSSPPCESVITVFAPPAFTAHLTKKFPPPFGTRARLAFAPAG
jgi:hypothetical protein